MTSTEFLSDISKQLPPGHPWGQHLIHLQTVDSTNTYAKKLAQEGACHGTIVIADSQSGGRGRMGRSFSSPTGLGLYFSLILRPHCPAQELMHLTCAVAVAASEAVSIASGITPGIKWTNDLVVGKEKLGGILTELSIDPVTKLVDYAIVGIGINCCQQKEDFPTEIRAIATSLSLSGGKSHRAPLAAALIDQLYQISDKLLTQKEQIIAIFSQRCVTIGQEISILRSDHVQHARAIGIDPDGALIVQLPDGKRSMIASGEVSIRGMYGYL